MNTFTIAFILTFLGFFVMILAYVLKKHTLSDKLVGISVAMGIAGFFNDRDFIIDYEPFPNRGYVNFIGVCCFLGF